jgi:hypothetical protein
MIKYQKPTKYMNYNLKQLKFDCKLVDNNKLINLMGKRIIEFALLSILDSNYFVDNNL